MLRDDQLALLEGCPAHWRYALTGLHEDAKRCFEEGWNEPGAGRTRDSILALNSSEKPSERWKRRTVIGVGVITAQESGGLLVIDFDGRGSQAVRAFKAHFRRNPSDLGVTACNISGKPGRAKVFLHVGPQWFEQLGGRSASWRDADGNVVLEAIWANGTGRGRHAVIAGDHPESSHQRPLWYRWAPGCSPAEVGVAEAPEWLLLGILAQLETASGSTSLQERQRRGDDDATPWERLTSAERRELVELALPHCPNRLAKGSGTYERARRVMAACLNEFGLETAISILCGSSWDAGNEWEGTDCETTLRSLAKSRVSDENRVRIASLFWFAREAGWTPPPWATPPTETKAAVEGLRKLVAEYLRHRGDAAAVATILGRARREFGVEPDRLRSLAVDAVLGVDETVVPRTMSEIVATTRSDNKSGDVIGGLLGRSVHLLVGASHSGKTTLACFLANRVVLGQPLDIDDVRHPVERPGRVLVFSSDCSDHELVRELSLEGLSPDICGDQLRICSGVGFDDMILIATALNEFAPDLVIYDSLMSMSARDVKIGEAAIADPIRTLVRHNGKAWPQCAHLILHHTTRDEVTRFSGSEFIKAASQELWLYYPPELRDHRRGQPRPEIGATRHLVMEKSRSGYAGKCLAISRNAYQGSWSWRQNSAPSGPMDLLMRRFRSVRHDRWQIASEWARELELEFAPRSLRRYLAQMDGFLESSIRRNPGTGRQETHYRPCASIRDAAQAMVTSRGDGLNAV